MTDATIDASTKRFEAIWANAQSSTAAKIEVHTDVDIDPASYLENYLPQHYAARFADLADQCFAEKQLTADQHAQLKQASAVQQQIFSDMDQEMLKRIIKSIDV